MERNRGGVDDEGVCKNVYNVVELEENDDRVA